MPQSRTRTFLWSSGISLLIAVFGSAASFAAPAPIVVKNSNKCLDVVGGPKATQDGALLEQWTCTGELNQQWVLTAVGSGQFQLVAQHSGKCIEAANGGTGNGTSIQQMECNGTPRQLWKQVSTGATGEYNFVNVPSNRCLDVTGGPQQKENGALLELWDCTGAFNQSWAVGHWPGTRNALAWPFSETSIWNTPIGRNAVYKAANLAATLDNPNDTVDRIWTPMPNVDNERIVLRPTAPITTIAYSDAGWSGRDRCVVTGGSVNGLPVNVPIPTNYVQPSSNRNEGAAFLLADGRTLVQTQPFARCTAGGPATSIVRMRDGTADADIFTDGRVGAHGGSKLSTLGGAIRLGELRPGQQGPRHALKINVFEKMAFFDCAVKEDCFRWPAFVADSNAINNYGSINNNTNTSMKMGALLAIPFTVSISSLGLESEPGRQIAWTLQNYGAYIVDSAGGPAITLSVEDGVDGSKPSEFQADYGFAMEARIRDNTAWTRDMERLVNVLQVVDNNTSTTVGGGGIPRQPLAPPFQ